MTPKTDCVACGSSNRNWQQSPTCEGCSRRLTAAGYHVVQEGQAVQVLHAMDVETGLFLRPLTDEPTT